MEYPQIIMNDLMNSIKYTRFDEMAHNWFAIMLGTNEY